MVRINFVLPATNDTPIGGYKIVYQYANALSQLGHEVTISFTYRVFPNLNDLLRQKLGRIKKHLLKTGYSNERITWFKINKKIKIYSDLIDVKDFPDADVVIATAASTAKFVSQLPISKGKKFYFIQNFETWWFNGDVNELNKTFNLGLHNIVISQDLKNKVIDAGAPEPSYLPNFYDHDEFNLVRKIEERKNKVALLNHIQLTKRTKFGLDILEAVKEEIPDLEVELFGAYPAPEQLPEYIHYTYKASAKELREEIYGTAKVYLMPSILEGWGLTGMEAMASGALVVASRIGGITDYANDRNSELVQPDDKTAFVQAVKRALRNDDLRITLSKQALNDMGSYQISRSVELLESFFK